MAFSPAVTDTMFGSSQSSLLQTASEQHKLPLRFQSTGLKELDDLLRGGLPLGKITQVSGHFSSGKTSLILKLLAGATQSGKLSAYIDTFSTLDPEYAGQAGIVLEYLLWVRCQDSKESENPGRLYEKALKATDILARSGDFGVVVLDMMDPPDIQNLTVKHCPSGWNFPLHAWFRLQRALKGRSTALVVLSSESLAGRTASVALCLRCSRSHWVTAHSPLGITGRFPSLAIGNLFQGIESKAQLIRGSANGSIKVYCRL